jgi:hypothetical protein
VDLCHYKWEKRERVKNKCECNIKYDLIFKKVESESYFVSKISKTPKKLSENRIDLGA